MKNLENYRVEKLNFRETNETNGGNGAPWHIGWIIGRISKYNGNSTHIWGY
jgi:hypothetical protein